MLESTRISMLIFLLAVAAACNKQSESHTVVEYRYPQSSDDTQLQTSENLQKAKQAELETARVNADVRKAELDQQTEVATVQANSQERLAKLEAETYLKALEINKTAEVKQTEIKEQAAVEKARLEYEIRKKRLDDERARRDQDRDFNRTVLYFVSALLMVTVLLVAFVTYLKYRRETNQSRQHAPATDDQRPVPAVAAIHKHKQWKREKRRMENEDEDCSAEASTKSKVVNSVPQTRTGVENTSLPQSIGVRNRKNSKWMDDNNTEAFHTLVSEETDVKRMSKSQTAA